MCKGAYEAQPEAQKVISAPTPQCADVLFPVPSQKTVRTAGEFGSVLAGFFRVVYVSVIRRSLGVLVPAAGLSDHGGRHERDACGEARDVLAKFGLVLPLPFVCVVDVNVLRPVAFVVGAPAQDVDAAVQHGYARFSVSGWEGR